MAARIVRPTIRTRLTLAAIAVSIVMLAVASFTLVTIQRRSLTAGIDESLRQTADNLAPIASDSSALPPSGDREDTFVQVIDADGHVVAATSNLADRRVIDDEGDGITTVRVDQPAGRFRILTRTLDVDGRPVVLIVGKNLDDVSESIHILITALAIVSPVLILLFGGLSWWLVGRTLRPVDAIRSEVQDIGGSELHRRVPVPDTDDEIATLARTMNDMLARVQSAGERQQQFVDDASHELRTPLTRMITDIDVAMAHPDAEDPQVTLRRIHEDASDLRRLLQELLFLARSARDRPVPDTEIDLDDIVLTVAADARRATTVTIDTGGVTAASTRGDERAIDRAVANVVANAIHHARSTVILTVREHQGTSEIVVDDDGAGIAPEHRQRVFERFTRLDEARGRDDGGAGLGLAIASEIVARHGGTIVIADNPSGGARVTVSLRSATPTNVPTR